MVLSADSVENRPSPHHQSSFQSQELETGKISRWGADTGRDEGLHGKRLASQAPGAGHISLFKDLLEVLV